MLGRFGEYEQSIEIADHILSSKGAASPYGNFSAISTKVCSLTKLERHDEARQLFNTLKQSPRTNISAAIKAGRCLGDIDFVATLYLQRLEDMDDRSNVLMALSTYATPNSDKKTNQKSVFTTEILKRPEIQTAIANAGRLRHWELKMRY